MDFGRADQKKQQALSRPSRRNHARRGELKTVVWHAETTGDRFSRQLPIEPRTGTPAPLATSAEEPDAPGRMRLVTPRNFYCARGN